VIDKRKLSGFPFQLFTRAKCESCLFVYMCVCVFMYELFSEENRATSHPQMTTHEIVAVFFLQNPYPINIVFDMSRFYAIAIVNGQSINP